MTIIGGSFEVVGAEILECRNSQVFSQKRAMILRFLHNSMVNIPSPEPKIIGLFKFT